jgi:hypothetical protein
LSGSAFGVLATGGSIDLSDQDFLSDPEGQWTKHLNAKLVAFDRLDDKPCFVLLGEPGIGKSWTLDMESSRVQSSIGSGAKLLRRDLRAFGDEGRLMKSLFESFEFESWKKGDWLPPFKQQGPALLQEQSGHRRA